MRAPKALRDLDDRVLGRRGDRTAASAERRAGDDDRGPSGRRAPHADGSDEVYPEDRSDPPRGSDGDKGPAERSHRPVGDVARHVLSVVWTVARYVFLLLAFLTFLAIVFTFTPANPDNAIVGFVLDLAARVAGPFVDVFQAESPDREVLLNYGLATVVYLVAASLVTKLPGRRAAG
jgi:hypothetical protein